MPATAASTDPSTKVKEITLSVFTPISAATLALNETARIAVPMRVWNTMRCRTIISATDTMMVTTSTYPSDTGPKCSAVPRGSTPNTRGLGPKRYWPPYSRKKLTPMAVMSEFSRGAFRSGR